MSDYKKNFLTNVVIKIDFEQPMTNFTEEIIDEIYKCILSVYPEKVTNDIPHEQINIDTATGKMDRTTNNFKEYRFLGTNKEKEIILTKDFVAIICSKYINYENFIYKFNDLLKIIDRAKVLKCSRLGFRYINSIDLNTAKNPLKWKNYIHNDLFAINNILGIEANVTKTHQIIELKYEDDINIQFQFGMFNPDYPSVIKKKVFNLDFDGSKVGSLTIDDISDLLPEIHKKIKELFEKSISAKTRELLNA